MLEAAHAPPAEDLAHRRGDGPHSVLDPLLHDRAVRPDDWREGHPSACASIAVAAAAALVLRARVRA